jgi:hypothetical protein
MIRTTLAPLSILFFLCLDGVSVCMAGASGVPFFLFVFCIEREYPGHLQTSYIPHLVHRDSGWNLDRYIVR